MTHLSQVIVTVTVVLAAPLTCSAAAQETAARNEPPQFDVASIKPIASNVPNMGAKVYPGGRVEISGFSLKGLIAAAFDVPYLQISGGDAWSNTDTYLLVARPPEAAQSSIKTLRFTIFGIDDPLLRQMLQSLLIDRFRLKFHRENGTGDVYLLERNQKPLALKPSKMPERASEHNFLGSIGYAGGEWNIFNSTMPQLAKFAGMILHAPVLDRTELAGAFDYHQPQPDLEPQYGVDQTDSFKAFLAQAGLKFERSTDTIDTFVIDHATRPDLN